MDLAKAYDRLSWALNNSILQEVALPGELINIIMACITTVHTNILLNGERTQTFLPKRGIRQDLMSLYLFVPCIDKLSHLITKVVDEGRWKPFLIGKHALGISHLMFADDLLLFGKAELD